MFQTTNQISVWNGYELSNQIYCWILLCLQKYARRHALSHTHFPSQTHKGGAWIGGRAENMGKLQNPVAKNPIYTIKIA